MELFSDKQKFDYEKFVKESEAMCNIIVENNGANATLDNPIKKLKGRGENIHLSMENAFVQLYGYASDSEGIRHGAIEFV